MSRKRYAIVGTGSRARMFYKAIIQDYRESAELVGLCDVNQTRMDYANSVIREQGGQSVPTYRFEAFERMIGERKPQVVIVCSIDRTHHAYINRALELGCEVITEKPMTVDEEKCQSILDTVKRTGGRIRVSFNYRYAPHNSKLKELLLSGAAGEVYSVHFEWLLDVRHGADYFRRWHRDKRNSGGLLVHKACHHFDLVNFWLDSWPKTVFAFGDLLFYGRENAERRGVTRFYTRAHGSEASRQDPFALNLEDYPRLKAMYLEAEKEDGYYRDQSVFGDGISIEDTMGVIVRFRNRAILTYSLNTYLPKEGFRVAINGSKGRIELSVSEQGYAAGAKNTEEGDLEAHKLTVYPMFGESYQVDIPISAGGHGGGDPLMLRNLFQPQGKDPLGRPATHLDGARAILIGIAANISMRTGLPVQADELIRF